jgi:hypothetical protein
MAPDGERKTKLEKLSLGVYQRVRGIADGDSLHEVIAKKGVEILRKGLPYVVLAARLQKTSEQRTEGRRSALRTEKGVGWEAKTSWDPYEKIEQSEGLHALATALSELPDTDVLAVWRNAEGYSDEEIIREWHAMGFQPVNPSPDVIRKRRERARQWLKARVQEILGIG